MNKKITRNASERKSGKRESRPSSQGSTGKRRHQVFTRSNHRSSPDSGINFVVNVSSSGTNLNKKIEEEMAKLDQIDRKMRNKTYTPRAPCITNQNSRPDPNQRKLKFLLENMLATIGSSNKKKRKPPQSYPKNTAVEEVLPKYMKANAKPAKLTTHLAQLAIESITNVNNGHINKTHRPDIPTKRAIINRKSALKKPLSAPAGRKSILADDLKFAENMKFARAIDLHLTISEIKQLASISNTEIEKESNTTNTKNENNEEDKKTDLNIIVENVSGNDVSYIYDTASVKTLHPNSVVSIANNLPVSPIPPRSLILSQNGKRVEETQYEVEVDKLEDEVLPTSIGKPEKKKFYSFLKRGNFTISKHSKDDCSRLNDDHEEEEKKNSTDGGISDQRCSDVEVNDDEAKGDENDLQGTEEISQKTISRNLNVADTTKLPENKMTDSQTNTDTRNDTAENVPFEISQINGELIPFPTELLERSILAVEKILLTIDTMANDFSCPKEIKDPFFGDNLSFQDSFDLMTASDSFRSREILQSRQNQERITSFKFRSANTNEDTNMENHIACTTSSRKPYRNSRQEVRLHPEENVEFNEIISLKPPIDRFYESEDSFESNCINDLSPSTRNEENLDPLKKALLSLKMRVNSIKKKTEENRTLPNSLRPRSAPIRIGRYSSMRMRHYNCFENDRFRNDSFTRKLLSDSCNSTATSSRSNIRNTSPSTCSSNESSESSIRSSMRILKSIKQFRRTTSRSFNFKERRVFPEQNFEKCMMLLRKKFKDFEILRNKTIHESTIHMSRNEEGQIIESNTSVNITCNSSMKIRNYEVCFENRNFIEHSETSVDSSSKTVIDSLARLMVTTVSQVT